MQEFNLESFSDFIKKIQFEIMSVEDYILVIEELFDIRPTKRSSSFITYHSFCHHEDERKGGENLSLKIETMMFTCYSHCGSFDLLELVKKRYELIGESKKPYKCMQLICKSCGKFVKNANKDDLREIEASNSEVEPINNKYTIMIMELQNLINAINKTVNEEDNNFPKSDLDAIRKSSKVYELERVKYTLEEILNRKDK